MHGGHQAAFDAPFVVQHLGHGREAVGGAAGVADDGLAGVLGAVDAIDEHGGVVFAGGAHDDFLGAGADVFLRAFLGEEQAGDFDDDVRADFAPFEVGGVFFGGEADFFAVDDQGAAFDADFALEAAVDAIPDFYF